MQDSWHTWSYFKYTPKKNIVTRKDKRLYWEMIKMEIGDFGICFCKRLSEGKKRREIDLFCKNWMRFLIEILRIQS